MASYFDAGAGKSDADVRALMDLAATTPNLEITVRACHYPHRVKDRWHPLFTSHASEALGLREVLEEFRQRQHHEQGCGTFFNRPGNLYCTPTALIVCFEHEFSEQAQLLPTIDRINAKQHRIPWLDNCLLVLSTCPTDQPRARP
ncbi:MAG: hypothetical protein ACYC3X_01205 [Pirellulaceae bacterium]